MKKKHYIICAAFFLMSLIKADYYREQKALQEDLASRVLRFHLRANSNTEEDQAIKYKVRDELTESVEKLVANTSSLQEAEKIVREHMPELIEEADRALEKEGVAYRASGTVGTSYFPEKKYDRYVFPEGEYRALQICLGSGQGKNWWCVLFPSLCFLDESCEIVGAEGDAELRKQLTEEEYEAVARQNGKPAFRFKILQIFGK